MVAVFLSTRSNPCHFLQPGQGIVEECPEGCTVIILMFPGPVSFAAAPADGEVRTGPAVFRTQGSLSDKADTGRGGKGFLYCHFPDVADFPFIQHIEITGIHTAICFYDMLATAASTHATGLGTPAPEHVDEIDEVANVYEFTFF